MWFLYYAGVCSSYFLIFHFLTISFRIVTFQRKTDAYNISLVLNTQASGINFQGLGYHFPSALTEPPTGMDSYPAIFSYPNVSTE